MGHLKTGDGLDSARGLWFADGCFRNIPQDGGWGGTGTSSRSCWGNMGTAREGRPGVQRGRLSGTRVGGDAPMVSS